MRTTSRHGMFHCIALASLLMLSGQPAWSEGKEPCGAAMPVPLNSTLRLDGLEAGQSHVFALNIASPGILIVEAGVSVSEVNELGMLFLGESCTATDSKMTDDGNESLRVSPQSQMLTIGAPGRYYLRVFLAEPSQSFGSYKLMIYFINAQSVLAGLERQRLRQAQVGRDAFVNKSDEEDTDIDEELSEILSSKSRMRPAWCHRIADDDHGDLRICATSAIPGELIRGELNNLWRDDYDYVTFTLSSVQAVRIESTGSVDTIGSLYSQSGHRLAAVDHGGEGDNFRMDKILGPGRYFIRVEGAHGEEGPYLLLIN